MSWNVNIPKGDGGDFPAREVMPADQYPAVLIAMVDLGTQRVQKFQSQEMEEKRQVVLVWEIQGPKTEAGEPFYLAERYNLSLHEKATFRKVLLNGGLALPDDGSADITQALGKPYLIDVEVGTSQKGNEYNRIAKDGVQKLPNAMRKGLTKPTRPSFAWQISQGLMPNHSWLPFVYGKPISDHQKASKEIGGASAASNGQVVAVGASADEETPF